MKRVLLAVALSACLPAQRLDSPCKDQPATDGGSCPSCETDGDCSIASNPCYESAACVPTAGNWAVTLLGCSVEHPPPVEQCGCVNRVCQAK
ncbi:MAG: hypothetical protein ACO1OB_05245 [Archangium sp.]